MGAMNATFPALLLFWGAILSLSAAHAQATFQDDFSAGKLNPDKWTVATYKSPDSATGINNGVYAPSTLNLDLRMLRITVHKDKGESGVDSRGGAIISKERFGFGTYVLEMRMSSTSSTPDGKAKAVSGAVSSGFLYFNRSETEIDLEYMGNEDAMWLSTWRNLAAPQEPTPLCKTSKKLTTPDLSAGFHRYELVWLPDRVDLYIDGSRVARQTEHVPQVSAHIILQHRGTNSPKWGGTASLGTDRYFFVRKVEFTPWEPVKP
jgi:beta-glucanase (GH16 family)